MRKGTMKEMVRASREQEMLGVGRPQGNPDLREKNFFQVIKTVVLLFRLVDHTPI